ncbi:unnamed protein product [Chilo suppressalis]|uniref:ZAD domain-containing protein n=1 Tax=Chilo suppressalis TaxID=168631 RepID=A0ABN8B435_CHISP|nr:unnamed protein product [Chilo suppressalis]
MDFSMVCRTCLSAKNLHPIFINTGNYRNYSDDIYVATGVKVNDNDGLPQNMCTDCVSFVNTSMIFRKQCNHIQIRLINLKNSNCENASEKIDSCETNNVDTYLDINKVKTELNIDVYSKPLNEESVCFDKVNSALDSDKETSLKTLDCSLKEAETTKIKVRKRARSQTVGSKLHCSDEEVENTQDDKLVKVFDPLVVTQNVAPVEKLKITKAKVRKKDEYKILANNDAELPYYEVFDANAIRQRVSCKLCQKNLSIRSIDAHMSRSHPGADVRKVKCELCNNFVLKEKLNRHKAMMHGSECFRCGYCKLDFNSKEVLIEHVTVCTMKKKRRRTGGESARVLVECDVCNKQMQKASLRMHKLIKHAGLGPVCEHCGKRMGNKYRLNEHYRAKHGYEKFNCTYCAFQSASAMAIRDHERRHRGEKPFVCETCGHKFHAAYLLAQHKQSHRTDKQYKCDQCPAMFKANNSLHMHKYTCHSSAIYRCGVCSRAYSCRQYVVKHLRRVHRNHDPRPNVLCEPSDI